MSSALSNREGLETSVCSTASTTQDESVARSSASNSESFDWTSSPRTALLMVMVGLIVGLSVGGRLASNAQAQGDLRSWFAGSDARGLEAGDEPVLASDLAAAAEYMSASIGPAALFNPGQTPNGTDGNALTGDSDGASDDDGEALREEVLRRIGAADPTQNTDGVTATPSEFVIVTRGEIGDGESLGGSLDEQGIDSATIALIENQMRGVVDFRRSRPGDRYRLGQDLQGRVLDFRYSHNEEASYYLYWDGMDYAVREEETELYAQVSKIAGMVDSSFYGAVQALGEETSLASEFARIFAWDIDFSRNVQAGDEFSILYERLYRTDEDGNEVYVRPGRILAGRYDGHVGDYTVVYYEDGEIDDDGSYFRPDGTSVERAFLAAPLEYSRISSKFTRSRAHPILKVTRPHPGIDYAAPTGTPVYSVAEGVVEYRARAGASGNLVRIRHPGGYTSHYAHLSRFESDLKVGDRVSQKEIIGYVGSTGLATGPHVCFRVKKNGEYVDPMKISSPAGSPVDETELAHFEIVRDELLANLGQSPVTVSDEAL